MSLLVLAVASSGLVGFRADAAPRAARPTATPTTGADVELRAQGQRAALARHGAVAFRAARTAPAASTAAFRTTAGVNAPHLSYYGGPVVSAADVHPVLYGTSGTFLPQLQAAAPAPNVRTFLDNYLVSPAYTWLSEYDTDVVSRSAPRGTPGTNQHLVAGTAVDATPIMPTTSATSITDLTIQQQLAIAIGNTTLPAPTVDATGHAKTVYPVFTPSGVTVCLDVDTCSLRTGGFCAYHGTFDLNGTPVVYTVQPDLTAIAASGNCGPGTPFQVTTSVLSHEIVEAVTDPLGPVASDLGPPLGWYDHLTTQLGEVTDICEDTTGTFVGADTVTYTVQGQWSNAKRACIVDPARPPLSTPAVLPGAGSALDTTSAVERRLDTRPSSSLGPQGQVTIHTTATGASAVVLNVTATGATATTYITVWPCDQPRPGVSSLNVGTGDTVANLVTVQVSASGDVCAYNNAGRTHLVVDQMASYKPVTGKVAVGRFVPQNPARAVDTRLNASAFRAGEERVIDLKTVGVPADAQAAVVTITAPDAVGPGYWAVWPSGGWPGTSSLNLSARNQTRANQSVVPVSGGTVKVRSQVGGHVVVDVAGWFTGAGAPSTSGLFHPQVPERVIDTRTIPRLVTGANLNLVDVVDPEAWAVAANVTATGTVGPGFLTVYPSGEPVPTASNLNFPAQGTVPGHVIVGLGLGESGWQMGFRSNIETYLIVDLFGWYS